MHTVLSNTVYLRVFEWKEAPWKRDANWTYIRRSDINIYIGKRFSLGAHNTPLLLSVNCLRLIVSGSELKISVYNILFSVFESNFLLQGPPTLGINIAGIFHIFQVYFSWFSWLNCRQYRFESKNFWGQLFWGSFDRKMILLEIMVYL